MADARLPSWGMDMGTINQSSGSIIADEAASVAYFRRAGLVLSRADACDKHLMDRWWLTYDSGGIFWYANGSSTVSSLTEVWEQWWLRLAKIDWHERAARKFAHAYVYGGAVMKAEVEAWLANGAYFPSGSSRQTWPWRSAQASFSGGPIQLAGWPWHEPMPSSRHRPDMIDPHLWMERARVSTEISSRQPMDFVASLRRHISQEEFLLERERATAAARTLRSEVENAGGVGSIQRL